MTRVLLLALLLVVFLAYAKQERYFERAGIVHRCTAVQTPAGEEGFWQQCEQGLIDGYPDLSLDSCTRMGRTTGHEFWRCPAELQSNFSPSSG